MSMAKDKMIGNGRIRLIFHLKDGKILKVGEWNEYAYASSERSYFEIELRNGNGIKINSKEVIYVEELE